MDDLRFYLPGTGDNLLFLTMSVLVLLMITGIYGYLNLQTHQRMEATKLRWGWPALSLLSVCIFFYWFGQPTFAADQSGIPALITQFSPFLVGLLVIGFGGAAVLSSDLEWSLTAAAISFLCSGMLFMQADILPLVLLCWLTAGGCCYCWSFEVFPSSNHRQRMLTRKDRFVNPSWPAWRAACCCVDFCG